jgi:hypothetical protein
LKLETKTAQTSKRRVWHVNGTGLYETGNIKKVRSETQIRLLSHNPHCEILVGGGKRRGRDKRPNFWEYQQRVKTTPVFAKLLRIDKFKTIYYYSI